MVTILEDDDDSDDSVIDITDTNQEHLFVTKNEVAQAFSHFSHHWTRENMLICDLQGVYDASKNLFCFTDPVVHYHNARKPKKAGQYGKLLY